MAGNSTWAIHRAARSAESRFQLIELSIILSGKHQEPRRAERWQRSWSGLYCAVINGLQVADNFVDKALQGSFIPQNSETTSMAPTMLSFILCQILCRYLNTPDAQCCPRCALRSC